MSEHINQYDNSSCHHTDQNTEAKVERMVNTLYGLLSSMMSLGLLLGSVFVPFISLKVGMRNGLLVAAINQFIANGLLTVAFATETVPLAFIARFQQGFSYALSRTMTTCFLTEVSPSKHLGTMSALTLPIIALIQLFVFLLGNPIALGTVKGLPILSAVGLIPAALMIMVLPFIPETPSQLLSKGKDTVQYIKSIYFYHGVENREEGATEMLETSPLLCSDRLKVNMIEDSTPHFVTLVKSMMCKEFFIGSLILLCTHQYGGALVVLSYSTTILEESGFDNNVAESITTAMPVVFLVLAIASVPMFKRSRRPLFLITSFFQSGQITIFIILSTCITDFERNDIAKSVAAGCLILYGSTSIVIVQLGYLIASELMSQNIRGSAIAIMVFIVGIFEIVSLAVYTIIADKVGYGVALIPFVTMTLPGLVVLFKYQPETKG